MAPPRQNRCGTPSGYRRHQLDGEKPCDACAKAKAEYDHRRRKASNLTIRNRLHARAQMKAYSELKRRYPDEYAELYQWWKAALRAAEPEASEVPK